METLDSDQWKRGSFWKLTATSIRDCNGWKPSYVRESSNSKGETYVRRKGIAPQMEAYSVLALLSSLRSQTVSTMGGLPRSSTLGLPMLEDGASYVACGTLGSTRKAHLALWGHSWIVTLQDPMPFPRCLVSVCGWGPACNTRMWYPKWGGGGASESEW